MLNPRQRKGLARARRVGLYGSSLGVSPLLPAARFRSQRVAPSVMRQAQRNKQAGFVNRNPYAVLGMRLIRKRGR